MATQRRPPLDRLAVFDAAARHLSFTRAAQECFLTQSAVSRQVAALEEALGTPLFRRGHRRLTLTEAGQRLAKAVARALAEVDTAVDAIRHPQRREVLALTTTPGLASLWLIPRLSGFLQAHPGIDVRIDATLASRDLAADGFDLAIRYQKLDAGRGEPLFGETVLPLCAPSMLAKGRPPLREPADLARHTLLKLDLPDDHGMPVEWQSWLQAVGAADVEPAAMLSFTQYDAAVAAAVAGQGVLLGRRPLVDRLITQGALVAPFKAEADSPRGYALIVAPAAARRDAVQALVRWLVDEARPTAAPAPAPRKRATPPRPARGR